MHVTELEPPSRLHPRLAFRLGAAMAASGALLAGRIADQALAMAGPITFAVLGIGLMLFAARALAERHAIDREVARALDQRAQLSRDLAQLVQKGGKVTRYLETKGFRQPSVRRWIATQFVPLQLRRPVAVQRDAGASGQDTEATPSTPAITPLTRRPSFLSHGGIPEFSDQIFGLPPMTKIVVGPLLLLSSFGSFAMLQGRVYVHYWFPALMVIGLAALLIGVDELRRKRAMEREVARALERRDELEKALGDLAREGGNVARCLQQEGFRDYVVRRWIALEFVPPREGA